MVLQGICQYLNIEIPKTVELPSSENLIKQEKVTIEDFEEFGDLVTMGDFDKKELAKHAKKLYNIYKKNIDSSNVMKYYSDVTEKHFDFFRSLYYWETDWKFDPEDAEYWISEITGLDFNFVYPSRENYGQELFPNIQSALAKLGMTLMTCETMGDFYIFFAVKLSDLGRILELSEITKIEVRQM